MDTIAATSPRWIDTAEVAKLIRKHLKQAHPTVKFSVRSRRYAGGSSIDISWTDGPTSAQVETITDPFAGTRFDGMIDLAYGAHTWYCPEHGARAGETYGHSYEHENGPVDSRCCHQAELVQMGAGYVHAQRVLSEEFRAELEAKVSAMYRQPYDPRVMVHGRWMDQHLHKLSRETAR